MPKDRFIELNRRAVIRRLPRKPVGQDTEQETRQITKQG